MLVGGKFAFDVEVVAGCEIARLRARCGINDEQIGLIEEAERLSILVAGESDALSIR